MRLSIKGRLHARTLCAVALLGSAFELSACGSSAGRAAVNPDALQRMQIRPLVLSDQQFASGVAQLLLDGEATGDRLNLLVAVVQHQLQRADRYFATGQEQAALDAVNGALLLVR